MKFWKPFLLVAGAIASASFSLAANAQETDLTFYGIQIEEFEHRWGDERERLAVWDADAFYGTDEFKLRWLGKGEYDLKTSKLETFENRLVGQVPVSEFFDVKAGVRLDAPKGKSRWYGVIGLTGLVKQWIEVDADLFVSDKGDASARVDAEYELLLTNRLILSPSAEIDFAFSDDKRLGVGTGFSTAEVGLRLSYDLFDRTLSPYVGAVWEQKFGRTADFARDDGEDTGGWFIGLGVRALF